MLKTWTLFVLLVQRVPTNKIFNRHIFRNAALPIASQLGYEITAFDCRISRY